MRSNLLNLTLKSFNQTAILYPRSFDLPFAPPPPLNYIEFYYVHELALRANEPLTCSTRLHHHPSRQIPASTHLPSPLPRYGLHEACC